MSKQNFLSLVLIISILLSCKAKKNVSNEKKVNDELNEEYKASRSLYKGTLSIEEYNLLRNNIENELGVKIAKDKFILINYKQWGQNCLFNNIEKKFIIVNNVIRISNDISKNFNAKDFFVYNDNVLNKSIFEKKRIFQLDSGFFKRKIFKLDINCSAFFILNTNKEFFVYYGEDYYTEVKKILIESLVQDVN